MCLEWLPPPSSSPCKTGHAIVSYTAKQNTGLQSSGLYGSTCSGGVRGCTQQCSMPDSSAANPHNYTPQRRSTQIVSPQRSSTQSLNHSAAAPDSIHHSAAALDSIHHSAAALKSIHHSAAALNSIHHNAAALDSIHLSAAALKFIHHSAAFESIHHSAAAFHKLCTMQHSAQHAQHAKVG